MVLREGTGGTFRNFIVQGFKETGVSVRDRSQDLVGGELTLYNSIVTGNGQGAFEGDRGAFANDPTNSGGDPGLAAPYNLTGPDFRPAPDGIAMNGEVPVATPPTGGFFEPVNYIGAFGMEDWMSGWTDFSQN
jgi:hypothetical protein